MKLYLVRHGETCWNRESRLQGVSDIALNENGIRLAKMTGKKIAHIPFDCAYSSPLIHGMLTYFYQRDVKDFWHDPVQKNCAISVVEVSNGDFSVLEEAKVLVKHI